MDGTCEILTSGEAAGYLSVSLRQFWRLVADQQISVVRIGKRCVRVRRAELERFLEASTVGHAEGSGS